MASVPNDLRYAKSHEWIDPGQSPHRVGITDRAQAELSDIVFVELPEAGRLVTQGEACCVVESCKAASDVYAPISGMIAAVNEDLEARPELVNKDPYGEGWLFSIDASDMGEFPILLDSGAYRDMT